MTPLEVEALLVRLAAALHHVETTDEDARWLLLAEVVDPGAELLAFSLAEARRRGPSKLATGLSSARRYTGAYRQTAAPRPQPRAPRRRWLGDDPDRVAAAQAAPAAAA
jgi:hypothetical protein